MPDILELLRAGLRDQYEIERAIGQGGMALVFLARDRRHDRPVAVKVLRPELARLLGTDRFHREIRIAAQLHHPHILPLYDSGEIPASAAGDPDLLYYVMPFIEGESLRSRLARDGPLPVAQALKVTREVAEALAYANGLGIVHRDIKPENILFTGDSAILADFGVARAILEAGGDELTSGGLVVGTPAYMSPEQGTGHEPVDARSDLYSLGCVVYEMLTGSPPFSGPTAHAIIARHQLDPPPPIRTVRPTVPPAVEALTADLLAKVPGDRPADAAELLARLDADLSALPAERPWRGLAAGGLGLGLLVLAIGWWLAQSGPGHRSGSVRVDPRQVAVLYFQADPADSELAPIAAGLTEDLISELAAVPALQVISAAGVRRFRAGVTPLDSLVRRLNVGTVVSGRVARDSGVLRVSYELADAGSGRQVAAGQVARPMTDLFTLQSELAAALAQALRQELGREVVLRESRSRAHNLEAWRRMQNAHALRRDARDLANASDLPGAGRLLARADSLLTEAEELDPDWIEVPVARGYVAYNQAIIARMSGNPGNRAAERFIQQGLDDAHRILEAHPDDPHALALRGLLRYTAWSGGGAPGRDSIRLAERDLEQAVDADPTLAGAWYTLSQLYLYTGRFSEAEAAAARALAADAWLASAPRIVSQLYFSALNGGNFAEARRWCDEGRRRFPEDVNFSDCGLRALAWLGRGNADLAEAGRELDSLEAVSPRDTAILPSGERRLLYAALLARSGRGDSARRMLEDTRAWAANRLTRADQVYLQYPAAWVYSLLGEPDSALSLLRSYLNDNPAARPYVAESRWFANLRDAPQFRRLVGLSTDQPEIGAQ